MFREWGQAALLTTRQTVRSWPPPSSPPPPPVTILLPSMVQITSSGSELTMPSPSNHLDACLPTMTLIVDRFPVDFARGLLAASQTAVGASVGRAIAFRKVSSGRPQRGGITLRRARSIAAYGRRRTSSPRCRPNTPGDATALNCCLKTQARSIGAVSIRIVQLQVVPDRARAQHVR